MPRPRYDGDQGGREPKLTPDPVTLGKIEMAASLMCPKSEIAHRLEVGRSTFFRFLAECEQARDAIDRGHDKFRFNLRVAQAQLAKKSPAMAIFLGKNYLDQTDVVKTEHDGSLTINISGPDASL